MNDIWWEKTPAEQNKALSDTARLLYIRKHIFRACDRETQADNPEEKDKIRLWIDAWSSLRK
ncbi:hypothetical protein [Oceanospirillum sediminis]|uniref:Uncharacterized protein n=1 Tax=Oceanospirillum sediminis TaxID=2760088 RepID=A0A839IQ91_9GAMM|nr:hypothetical protein [Oceanospirillum sediminis]MBB1487128.1 hypothetical protein [Oceanospirillum sediminis]